ncbi:putative regulator of nonsense transcripts UPF1 [Neospora caninum Liverpool]|uniref:Putative regulator of nonsense transcripts UPF1 n=1 Tax=Neospora caninum (strain Liverpool) TaxID=572307 RepID=F0VCC0_NEOCL|nr:putative regulator of nonsense transcripts UPF1 [Neospora caninum Liverpool]CBZ51254.1 putative regulator of nonsense transcripts UPF1 [Neospora caninum Liverpool]CEL68569.1 TPA: regulator of nonsense transcripts UPF1, putative [Neospora caninum Liverpool]|eukprot:XP_003881287.1 putative regulator of nonsense transcripts UPF1 [Neospora caninum Liverpool]
MASPSSFDISDFIFDAADLNFTPNGAQAISTVPEAEIDDALSSPSPFPSGPTGALDSFSPFHQGRRKPDVEDIHKQAHTSGRSLQRCSNSSSDVPRAAAAVDELQEQLDLLHLAPEEVGANFQFGQGPSETVDVSVATPGSSPGHPETDDSPGSGEADESCHNKCEAGTPNGTHAIDRGEHGAGVHGELDRGEKTTKDVPEHACSYCGASSPECVLKCCCCNKYFCNSPCSVSGSSMGSHIIFHLVKSRHREVMLHPEGPLGDCTLECFQCGSRNVFLLGLIPAEQEGVVVLICREPCLSSSALKQSGWDLSQWQPLIEGKSFLPWLVRPTLTADERRDCHVVTTQQLQRLEELWQKNPQATLEELSQTKEEAPLPSVKLVYEDGFDYQRTFAPLVQAEADFDKQMKDGQKLVRVKLRWEQGLNRRRLAYFMYARDEGCNVRVAAGDEVKISTMLPKSVLAASSAPATSSGAGSQGSGGAHGHDATSPNGTSDGGARGGLEGDANLVEWSCTGSITRFSEDSEEVIVEVKKPPNVKGAWDSPVPLLYTIEFVWKSTSFERMQAALRQLAVDEISVSSYLYHTLMGKQMEHQIIQTPMPLQISAPNLAPLNPSQMLAIRYALQHPLSLIQGPPGTGKTLTSSTLVYQMVKLSEMGSHVHPRGTGGFNKDGGQVLVVAPSNVAVDQLAERINRTGLKVIRMYSKSREGAASSLTSFCMEHLALHKKVLELKTAGSDEMAKYLQLKEQTGELAAADERRLRLLISRAEMEILQTADVICTTCVGAGDNRLQGFRFRQVVIDEAAQATEPECLIPIVLGAKQVVLIGDHCQLGPVVLSKKAAAAGLATSLFSRLLALGHRPLRLKVQYRMHPALSFFPSYFFYEGELQNGVTMTERTYFHRGPGEHRFPWPSEERPMFFYHSTASEEISGSGTSYVNRVEASNIEKIVTFLLKCGLKASQIGVITPYDGQRAHISSLFQRQTTLGQAAFADLEVASVDAFQGREKDFILLSCVRSNSNTGIGFLADSRRLNVAMTRAKYGLIICGNASVLANYMPRVARPPAGSASLQGSGAAGATSNALGPGGVAVGPGAAALPGTFVPEPPIWRLLIHHYLKYDLVVDGPLSNLKPSKIRITLPPLTPFGALTAPGASAKGGKGAGAAKAGKAAGKTKAASRYVAAEELLDYDRHATSSGYLQTVPTPGSLNAGQPIVSPAASAYIPNGAGGYYSAPPLYPSAAFAALLGADRGFQSQSPLPSSSLMAAHAATSSAFYYPPSTGGAPVSAVTASAGADQTLRAPAAYFSGRDGANGLSSGGPGASAASASSSNSNLMGGATGGGGAFASRSLSSAEKAAVGTASAGAGKGGGPRAAHRDARNEARERTGEGPAQALRASDLDFVDGPRARSAPRPGRAATVVSEQFDDDSFTFIGSQVGF